MVKLSNLEIKLCTVNLKRYPYMALYLHGNPAYYAIYNIMGPYKNYPNRLWTTTYNRFNKTMAKLCIEVKYGFALY